MKKKILLSFVIISTFITINLKNTYAEQPISYLFNGETNEETAEMLFMENNRIFVPLRAIFEELGAKVTWDQENREVHASKQNTELVMPVDGRTVFLNGESLSIDQPPVMRENHVFVPLRFVAETFDADVLWNGDTQTVSIDSGSDVENAYKDEEESGQTKPPLIAQDQEIFKWVPFWPGDSADKLTDLGKPDDVLDSQYSFEWEIYQENDSFVQIGQSNETLDAVFIPTTEKWFTNERSLTQSDVIDELGAPERWLVKDKLYYHYGSDSTWDFFKFEGMYVTVFYDHFNNSEVTAVMAISAEEENASPGFYGNVTENLQDSYEKQLFYLTNLERARHGVDILTWHDGAAEVARSHSEDMVENEFFDHENIDGESPFDRLRDHNVLFKSAGENLARRQMSPFHAMYNLMDSEGHRKNIMQDGFEEIGLGVSFEGDQPYFTQNFILGYNF